MQLLCLFCLAYASWFIYGTSDFVALLSGYHCAQHPPNSFPHHPIFSSRPNVRSIQWGTSWSIFTGSFPQKFHQVCLFRISIKSPMPSGHFSSSALGPVHSIKSPMPSGHLSSSALGPVLSICISIWLGISIWFHISYII
ncbi:hypothetical protein C8J56DRAFT_430820 [Mycena floridula]|nr:hypothetical protein C8J56DRAFT_430820 [Mycena floridula]